MPAPVRNPSLLNTPVNLTVSCQGGAEVLSNCKFRNGIKNTDDRTNIPGKMGEEERECSKQ